LAGLAAGLGIAALMSHFGLGEAFANMMMFALLAMIAVFAIGWLMRRFGKGVPLASAGAGAGAGTVVPAWQAQQPTPVETARPAAFTATSGSASAIEPVVTGHLASLPADFDVAGFERIAKTVFIRMQAANDAGQVDDLRKFTTPELFASLRVDLQERGHVEQQTDVEELHTKIVDAAQENAQQIVSVRFHGRLSERSQGQTTVESFAELWHFVRPVDGSREWAIAGITPVDGATQ
jgi:predicted lipid-binding transport protein (Tim44 family)